MKVCEVCGIEISTKDGDNQCSRCDLNEPKAKMKGVRSRQRREREAVMRSLGLVKVRGSLGGTYWE
jgi:uncharacterized Zn finger protein (UPF0148 family)